MLVFRFEKFYESSRGVYEDRHIEDLIGLRIGRYIRKDDTETLCETSCKGYNSVLKKK